MAEKLNQRIAALTVHGDQSEMKAALEAIIDGIRDVLAILDADAGVTATTTLATFDARITKE